MPEPIELHQALSAVEEHAKKEGADISERQKRFLQEAYGQMRQEKRDDVEMDVHSQLEELKGKVIRTKKDKVEEALVAELVERVPAGEMKNFYETLRAFQRENKDDVPLQVDRWLQRILKQYLDIQIDSADLRSLRDDLPIIDGFTGDGRFIAHGQYALDETGEIKTDTQGHPLVEAYPVEFNDWQIEKKGNQVTFVYKLYLNTENCSEEFKQLVTAISVPLGASDTVNHRFDVVLKGDQEYDETKANGNIAAMREVDHTDDRLEGHPGAYFRDGILLIDRTLEPARKEEIVRHEVMHLAGMTHAENATEADHQEAETRWGQGLASTGGDMPGEKLNQEGRREKEYFSLPISENDIRSGFDKKAAEHKQDILKTLEENGFTADDVLTNSFLAGVREYFAKSLPPIAKQRDVGPTNFLQEDAASSEVVLILKTSMKQGFAELMETVKRELEKYSTFAASYMSNSLYDLGKIFALSETLKNLCRPAEIKDFLSMETNARKQTITKIEQELQEKFDAQKKAEEALATAIAALPVEEAKPAANATETGTETETDIPSVTPSPAPTPPESFDALPPEIQTYLGSIPATLGHPDFVKIEGADQAKLQAAAQAHLKEMILAKLNDPKLANVKQNYTELLVKHLEEKKVISYPEKKEEKQNAYRIVFTKDKIEVVYGNLQEEQEKGKIPEEKKTTDKLMDKGEEMFGKAMDQLKKWAEKIPGFGGAMLGMLIGIVGGMRYLVDQNWLKSWLDSKNGEKKRAKIESQYELTTQLHQAMHEQLEQQAGNDPALKDLQANCLPTYFSREFGQKVSAVLPEAIEQIEAPPPPPPAAPASAPKPGETPKPPEPPKSTVAFNPAKAAEILFSGDCLNYFLYLREEKNLTTLSDGNPFKSLGKLTKDNFEKHALQALEYRAAVKARGSISVVDFLTGNLPPEAPVTPAKKAYEEGVKQAPIMSDITAFPSDEWLEGKGKEMVPQPENGSWPDAWINFLALPKVAEYIAEAKKEGNQKNVPLNEGANVAKILEQAEAYSKDTSNPPKTATDFYKEKNPETPAIQSLAAYEAKVLRELGTPLPEWFETQTLVVPAAGQTREAAWQAFFSRESVKLYLSFACAETQARLFDPKLSANTATLLEEAHANTETEDTEVQKQYLGHREQARSLDQQKYDAFAQGWNEVKGDDPLLTDVVLDRAMADTYLREMELDQVQEVLTELLEACLGGVEGVKKWCVFLAGQKISKLTDNHVTALQLLKEKVVLNAPETVDYSEVFKNYNQQHGGNESNPFPKSVDEFTHDLLLSANQHPAELKTAMEKNEWPPQVA